MDTFFLSTLTHSLGLVLCDSKCTWRRHMSPKPIYYLDLVAGMLRMYCSTLLLDFTLLDRLFSIKWRYICHTESLGVAAVVGILLQDIT